MKVILAGSTGFIGQGVLHQCLQNPLITSIIALSRRSIPDSINNPKLKVVIMEDFTSYPSSVLEELAGAEACIWSLGVKPNNTNNVDVRKIGIDYTLAAANAFTTHLAPQLSRGKKFRFVYCSGMLIERDQEKKLWFLQDLRHLGGEIINKLVIFAQQHQSVFEAFFVKPGYVLSKNSWMPDAVAGLSRCIGIDELAAVMVEMAVKGGEEQVLENDVLRRWGRELLEGDERMRGRMSRTY